MSRGVERLVAKSHSPFLSFVTFRHNILFLTSSDILESKGEMQAVSLSLNQENAGLNSLVPLLSFITIQSHT